MPEIESNDVSPQVMRSVLGTFTTGVVVVAALGGEDRPIGFPCQSFASLSLDPPLISFSAARTSNTWPLIRDVGRFCINVLAHDQSEISEQFARVGKVLENTGEAIEGATAELTRAAR